MKNVIHVSPQDPNCFTNASEEAEVSAKKQHLLCCLSWVMIRGLVSVKIKDNVGGMVRIWINVTVRE